jgi:hypothetical protein
MPRAGGTYFFVERSLGPIWGVFSVSIEKCFCCCRNGCSH